MTNKTFFSILIFIDLAILALVLNILYKTPAELVGISLILVSVLSFYGAAAVLLMSANKAEELGYKPMARIVASAAAGVPPRIMGLGPVGAVHKALNRAKIKLTDIRLIELNEAFASQSLYVIRELGLNLDIVNVNGGAVAMGHPLGCTGAKLTTTLLYEMKRRNVRYGLVTMCIGGGMGAAGIFENINAK
jgi:acetyl-CoA acyltransferase